MDYSDIGLDSQLRNVSGPGGRPSNWETALTHDVQVEQTPYASPTFISKGTMQANLGGILELRDATGGTILLTANPDTGVVTISGSLVANAGINIGTLSNSLISGTTRTTGTILGSSIYLGGTFNSIVVGSPSVTSGTFTSSVLNANTVGSPSITSGTLTSSVLNANTVGSPSITSGTLTSSVVNSAVIGTPAITGGSMNTATFGTPTVIRPTIDGTPNFDINAGSAALGADGDFAIQTFGSAGNLVFRVGGTTFRIGVDGTL